MHALTNDEDPFYSQLVFSAEPDSSARTIAATSSHQASEDG